MRPVAPSMLTIRLSCQTCAYDALRALTAARYAHGAWSVAPNGAIHACNASAAQVEAVLLAPTDEADRMAGRACRTHTAPGQTVTAMDARPAAVQMYRS